MDFKFEHAIDAPVVAVERALLAPGFAEALASSARALSEGRVISLEARGDQIERVAWFRAEGSWVAGPFARLGAVAWTERVSWSSVSHSGQFTVIPDVRAVLQRRVRCEGTYALVATGGGLTSRRVEGVIEVRAPLVGARAEARVVEMLQAIFDDEASLLATWARVT
jgi:hypothetical protein